MLYGAAYYPEHRPEECWEQDLDLMQGAHVNCLRVGEFAWVQYEPKKDQFDFDWLDRFLALAEPRGIRILLCPPLRTPPSWLVFEDPSVCIMPEEGTRLQFGGRYRYCINHPFLLERGRILAETMGQHYSNDTRVVGWHLCNEHGCEQDCLCPVCMGKFREWCRKRYEAIGDLNKAWGLDFWGLNFESFEQVNAPTGQFAGDGPGHVLAWRRFRSESTVAAVAMQAAALRGHADASQFITTNNQALWISRTDYFDMDEPLDICGTNYYPPYGPDSRNIALGLAACRGYKGKNFHVHELRNGAHMIPGRAENTPEPGEVARLAMHVVGNGADGIFFFRWDPCPFGLEQTHGTIQGFDGRPKRIYGEVRDLGEKLSRLTETLEGTEVRSEIGILYDFPTRWVAESAAGWIGPGRICGEATKTVYAALRGSAFNVDVIGRSSDWSEYRVLVVPFLQAVDDMLADRLVAFVADGGRLVWHPLCGVRDSEAQVFPERLHPKLRELLGVNIAEFATFGEEKEAVSFTWDGAHYTGSWFADLPVPDEGAGVETQGEFVDAWFAGTPAVLRRAAGKGVIHYVATFASEEFYADYISDVCAALGVTPILPAVPPEVEVCERRGPDGARLVFLLNHSHVEQSVAIDGACEDIYNQESVSGTVKLPAHGVRVLS